MKSVLLQYGFVAIGGALGAMARFGLNVLLQRDVEFPWGTISANLAGCFVMGIVAHLVATSAWFNETGVVPDQYRLLLAVGFCGSFTTLSAFVLELNTMIQKEELFFAFSYIVATLVGGFLCFYLGFVLMRSLGTN